MVFDGSSNWGEWNGTVLFFKIESNDWTVFWCFLSGKLFLLALSKMALN